jgi:hypothetical protein
MADADTTTTAADLAATAASAVIPAAKATPAVVDVVNAGTIVNLFGWNFNLATIGIMLALAGVLWLFYRIQKDEKLDFADLITKDGRTVSLTKVLQLIGGISGTWIVIKLTLTNGLTEAIFGLYLTYVGAIEGYSKFVAAKYGYNEKSVRDATAPADATPPKES